MSTDLEKVENCAYCGDAFLEGVGGGRVSTNKGYMHPLCHNKAMHILQAISMRRRTKKNA